MLNEKRIKAPSMENILFCKEMDEIKNNDFVPKNKFTYKKAILKKQKIKKKLNIDYSEKSTFDLFNFKIYEKEIIHELRKRPFIDIIAYFQSIPVLKDKLYYWNPLKMINDPLSLLMTVYTDDELIEHVKIEKCKSLIFHSKGFSNFEQMLQERINLGDLKVLDKDLFYFQKYWTIKKGKLANLNDLLLKNDVKIKHNRKTIDVYQRIITHPYWCDNVCDSSFSFIKTPALKHIDFMPVDCFSFLEIEIDQKILVVNFLQFEGLLHKDKQFEAFWNSIGVYYSETIELI